MDDRITREMTILSSRYPNAQLENRWVLVPEYVMPSGWNPNVINVAFYIRDGYPGTAPYGIYVPAGLRYNGEIPVNNFTEVAPNQPPFGGRWSIFSWDAEQWIAKAIPEAGHNLLTWVNGFATRFREGR